mmetsp:Transcript_32971/g.84014  ORF Transcript_32971/g.84014 Transcript_32971/m.84014 type:complete len:278 (-) Transcript_32971:1713-2546(-)
MPAAPSWERLVDVGAVAQENAHNRLGALLTRDVERVVDIGVGRAVRQEQLHDLGEVFELRLRRGDVGERGGELAVLAGVCDLSRRVERSAVGKEELDDLEFGPTVHHGTRECRVSFRVKTVCLRSSLKQLGNDKLQVLVHGDVQRFVAMHAKVFGVVRAETGAGVQAQVWVGARFDQSKRTLVMAALGGEEERCCSGPVANVQVRSRIDQHAQDRQLAVLRSAGQRVHLDRWPLVGSRHVHLHIHVGLCVEEHLHELHPAALRGRVERCLAFADAVG